MIGNDIVDLSITQIGEGVRRTRFLNKLFTDAEIGLVKNSKSEDLMIWLLWSIKESVYKIIVRQENRICYAPKSICCQNVISMENDSYESTVVYNNQHFASKSIIKGDCIHTIAFNEHELSEKIQFASFEVSQKESSSLFLDQQVINALKIPKNGGTGQVRIQRDEMRIPHFYKEDREIGKLSLSHHGRFKGYAYMIQ